MLEKILQTKQFKIENLITAERALTAFLLLNPNLDFSHDI
jgi:hypothetical protein